MCCAQHITPPSTQYHKLKRYVLLAIFPRCCVIIPANASFHHCIRILPGITFPRTESLTAAVSTLNALMANAAGLFCDVREEERPLSVHCFVGGCSSGIAQQYIYCDPTHEPQDRFVIRRGIYIRTEIDLGEGPTMLLLLSLLMLILT